MYNRSRLFHEMREQVDLLLTDFPCGTLSDDTIYDLVYTSTLTRNRLHRLARSVLRQLKHKNAKQTYVFSTESLLKQYTLSAKVHIKQLKRIRGKRDEFVESNEYLVQQIYKMLLTLKFSNLV